MRCPFIKQWSMTTPMLIALMSIAQYLQLLQCFMFDPPKHIFQTFFAQFLTIHIVNITINLALAFIAVVNGNITIRTGFTETRITGCCTIATMVFVSKHSYNLASNDFFVPLK